MLLFQKVGFKFNNIIVLGTNQKMLECDVAPLDVNTRIAKFPIKFLSGTKKAPAQIRFGMQIHFAGLLSYLKTDICKVNQLL